MELRQVFYLLLLILAVFAADAKAPPVDGYKLVWSDEFDGHALDLEKWVYRALGPRRDAINVKETVSLDGKVYQETQPSAVSEHERVKQKQKATIASQFIIGAFPGPPNGQINPARYTEIAEAGIDVIVPFWGTMDGASNPNMLDLAHAADLRVLAMDKRIGPITMTADSQYDPAVVENIAADYKDHPALFGYGVRDEPPVELFGRISEISDLFTKLDPNHPPLMDLFPGYAKPQQLGVDSYRDYVRKFVQQVDPVVLMYNHYPFRVDHTVDTGWHRDLALFREESRRAGIAFCVFAQCQGIRGYLRVPTSEEIFRQAATALAYGARGIWWYRYWTQPPDDGVQEPPPHPGSMIDQHGNRSASYYSVQETNRFLRQASPALLGWDNSNVARIRNGYVRPPGKCPAVTLTGEDFDVVVGTFTRGKTTRMVLANDSCGHSAAFRISPVIGWQVRRVIASWSARLPADLSAPEATWSLGPAGCVLIELARQKQHQMPDPLAVQLQAGLPFSLRPRSGR